MPDPFTNQPERGDNRFQNPNEEIEHLRAQVAERERQLAELGQKPERELATYEEVQEYKAKPPTQVLHEDHAMAQGEMDAFVLDLPPDDDDEAVQQLLGIVHEKGVKNALTVAAQVGNAHVEDDFHRALVQYIAHGYPAADLREKGALWNVLHMTLFEVTLPELDEDELNRPLEELISAMEQFYLGMFSVDADLQKRGDRFFTFEIAVSGDAEHIVFYIAVPKDKEDLFEKQLLSVFPKARAHHMPSDYNIFLHDGETSVAYAQLKEHPIYPIKDYRAFDHDPLNVLVNSFTNLKEVGEGAAIQMVINPIGSRYDRYYRKILDKVEEGMTLREALKDTPDGMAEEIFKGFKDFLSTKKQDDDEDEQKRVDDILVEQIRNKVETTIPSVNLRLIASAATQERARAIITDTISSYNQFHNPSGNRLRFDRPTGKKALEVAKQYTFREYDTRQAMPLSVREVTTLMHFPSHALAATPQLKRAKAALAPAPVGLPTSGTQLGVNSFRGQDIDVFLTDEDRLRHLYVIGQTGTGKSKFLLSLIKQDIDRGAGVCFIDPHGEDVNLILDNIPEHRMQDVIYFDPADTEHVLGLNMLEYDPRFPDQKIFVINELFGIFQKLYAGTPESMGPAFEQYFRNATALVLEDPSTGSTMLDISRVLADEKYRAVKLSRSKNPVVNQFWNDIATKAQGEASLQNIVPYITNKFDIFTANDIMRPIIAQQTSAFRMREVMDSSKILLVNLSKGKLGDINANLLGMILVGKMLMAALSRVDALVSDLPPFYLYIDEFHFISTNSIASILSEARKYKLSLNVAHQYISQLDDNIRDAVFGNVGTKAIFRVSYDDAQYLENQLKPVFDTQDIMNIEFRYAYLALLANGVPQKPFSIKTLDFSKGSPDRNAHVRKLSAQTYARNKDEINREIMMRYGIG